MRFTLRQPAWHGEAAAEWLGFTYPTAVFEGTAGRDRIKGTSRDDTFDMSQGGDDKVLGSAGDDTVYFGAAFTNADRVHGGKGYDAVILDGDYSAGLDLTADSLSKIEVLELEGGSFVITGYLGYQLNGGATVVKADQLTADQSLKVDVASSQSLVVSAGAGDDVLHTSTNGHGGYLIGGAGDDLLIGNGGPTTTLVGGVGADTIVMGGAHDSAVYESARDSTAKVPDTIENFGGSGGTIRLTFDSDTTTDGVQHGFHLGATADRAGDVLFHYDAGRDETIVTAFTDHDQKADFVLHLAGDVALTNDDFIFF